MKKNIFKIGLPVSLFALPLFVFAQSKNLNNIIDMANGYFAQAGRLIISLAILTFIWNVYRYFFTEKGREEAPKYVLYSVLGFFVILSIWGLVNLVSNTLNLGDNKQPAFPFGGSTQTNSQPINGSIPSGPSRQ